MKKWLWLLVGGMLAACETLNAPTTTLTPTRALSGPTLEPSATVIVRSVEQLDSDFTIGQNDLTAASVPSGGALPPLPIRTASPGSSVQGVEIALDDGTLLTGDLYTTGITRVPGVLIVGIGGTAWGDFPARLQAAGFTVLVVALREPLSTADFSAVLRALGEVGTVNPGSIGVIGAEQAADLALIGCALNLLCDTAVLLTPQAGDTLLNIIADYNPRPLLVAVDQSDTGSAGTAQALVGLATGETLLQPLQNAGQGSAMLENRRDLGELIIQWMQRQLAA